MTNVRGQISFIDLNDGKSLALNLEANQPLTQILNLDGETESDKFNPNYKVSPFLVINPVLFVSGYTDNMISHIAATPYWTVNGSPVNVYDSRNTRAVNPSTGEPYFSATDVLFSTVNPYTLTIKSNELMSAGALDIKCVLEYYDDDTELTTPLSATITIRQISVNEGMLNTMIYSKSGGTIFRNKSTEQVDPIVLHCDMYRGGSIDNTDVNYDWYRQDNPNDPSDDYPWYKIVNAAPSGDPGYIDDPTLGRIGYWVKNSTISINQGGNELTITKDAVTNYDAFMCICTDTSEQSTAGNHAPSVPIDILDYTDPFSLEFETPAGTLITRGTEYSDTTASIYQNGAKLSDAFHNACRFVWTKYNKLGVIATGTASSSDPNYYEDYKFKKSNGALVPDDSWGLVSGTYCLSALGSAGGRSLRVYRDEVVVKSTFRLEVIIP